MNIERRDRLVAKIVSNYNPEEHSESDLLLVKAAALDGYVAGRQPNDEHLIEVDISDLDYTLNALDRTRKKSIELVKVKKDYERLVKLTDMILSHSNDSNAGAEFGPIQALEKLVAVRKHEIETA